MDLERDAACFILLILGDGDRLRGCILGGGDLELDLEFLLRCLRDGDPGGECRR